MTSKTTKTLIILGILAWWFWPEEAVAAEEELPQSQIIPSHGGGGYEVHSAPIGVTPTYECKP